LKDFQLGEAFPASPIDGLTSPMAALTLGVPCHTLIPWEGGGI
jgi:hypothetical protein